MQRKKRPVVLVVSVVAVAAAFAGLVYAVLVMARVSEPAADTVRGLTPRRAWATGTALLALLGVVLGGVALFRPARKRALVACGTGLLAAVSGGLNLALASGGPGSGNGVVGAAAALVLGLVGAVLGGIAMGRSKVGANRVVQ